MSYLELLNKHVTAAQELRDSAEIDLENVDFSAYTEKEVEINAQAAQAAALLSISHELKALRLAIEGPVRTS